MLANELEQWYWSFPPLTSIPPILWTLADQPLDLVITEKSVVPAGGLRLPRMSADHQ